MLETVGEPARTRFVLEGTSIGGAQRGLSRCRCCCACSTLTVGVRTSEKSLYLFQAGANSRALVRWGYGQLVCPVLAVPHPP